MPERRFAITGFTPDWAGALSFAWEFEDDGRGGTRMTQRIQATGPEVEHHMTVFRRMELGAQAGMARLAGYRRSTGYPGVDGHAIRLKTAHAGRIPFRDTR